MAGRPSEEIEKLLVRLMGEEAGAYYAILDERGSVLASNLPPDALVLARKTVLSRASALEPGKFSLEKEDGLITLVLRSDEGLLVLLRAEGKPPGLLLLCARAISRMAVEVARPERAEAVPEAAPAPAPAPTPAPAPAPAPPAPGVLYELAPGFKSVDDVLRAMPSIGVLSGSPLLMLSLLSRLEEGPASLEGLMAFLREKNVQAQEGEVREMLAFLHRLGVVKRGES